MKTLDLLTRELLLLKAHLPNTPFLVGGGMGLYLRSMYHYGNRSPRYPRPVPTRSTQDIDVILSADLIVSAEHMDQIRDVLDELGYDATTEYFQFKRIIGDESHTVEVDLIAAPPHPQQEEQVKIGRVRIRPHKSEKIHARLSEESYAIDRGALSIDLSEPAQKHGIDMENPTVDIPSSFNYLILKLHAFSDRKDDQQADQGRHHAMDIFTTVTDMSKMDWQNAEQHFEDECDKPYLQEAINIQQQYFAKKNDLGIIRIRENGTYKRHQEEFDSYLSEVTKDLNDLFSTVHDKT